MTPASIPGVLSILGAESQSLPFVLDSPHSGTAYPADFVPAAPMNLLRMAEDTDIHVLFGDAVEFGAVILHAHFPRAYCDANRAEDDMDPAQVEGEPDWPLRPSAKSRLGIGLCWTRVPPDGLPLYARPMPAATLRHRVDTCHRPYHRALDALADSTHARWGPVWHINCHSMPQYANALSDEPAGRQRPDFVLGDRDGTTCDRAFTDTIHRFLTGRGYSVWINDPYKGVEIVRRHGRPDENRHSIQVEVNRALYMDEATRLPNDRFDDTRAALRALSRHLAGFIAERLP